MIIRPPQPQLLSFTQPRLIFPLLDSKRTEENKIEVYMHKTVLDAPLRYIQYIFYMEIFVVTYYYVANDVPILASIV